jgi:hypothetical protein
MRPYSEEVVLALQRGMAAHFAPELRSQYAQSQFGAAALLFGIALRDADTAAQNLIDANRELRELLADVHAALGSIDERRAEIGRSALARMPAAAADVRLSSLRAEFDGLRAVFSELAPVIEPAGDDGEMGEVRKRVYAWFSADARKRVVPILNN